MTATNCVNRNAPCDQLGPEIESIIELGPKLVVKSVGVLDAALVTGMQPPKNCGCGGR